MSGIQDLPYETEGGGFDGMTATDLHDRADRISDTVAAYEDLRKVFAAFSKIWREKSGEISGATFQKEEKDAFYLSMFDGTTVEAQFSMILDKAGNPWGRVQYEHRDGNVLAKFYFDQGGYIFPKPERRLDGNIGSGTSCIARHFGFSEIMIGFMESYLTLFRER